MRRSWTIFGGALALAAGIALFIWARAKKTAELSMTAQSDGDKTEFERQSEEAARLRKFAYSISEGKHHGAFERKDYIAFAFFSRCLQTHEAIEILARQSLLD